MRASARRLRAKAHDQRRAACRRSSGGRAQKGAPGGVRPGGYVKVAWALRVTPRGEGAAHLEREVRVSATDEESWRKFRRHFLVFGPVLVGVVRDVGGDRWVHDACPTLATMIFLEDPERDAMQRAPFALGCTRCARTLPSSRHSRESRWLTDCIREGVASRRLVWRCGFTN